MAKTVPYDDAEQQIAKVHAFDDETPRAAAHAPTPAVGQQVRLEVRPTTADHRAASPAGDEEEALPPFDCRLPEEPKMPLGGEDFHQAAILFCTNRRVPTRWKVFYAAIGGLIVVVQFFAAAALIANVLLKKWCVHMPTMRAG